MVLVNKRGESMKEWKEHNAEDVRDLLMRIAKLETGLDKLANWENAYPESVFPELSKKEWKEARKALAVMGLSLYRISASNMRHTSKAMSDVARKVLDA